MNQSQFGASLGGPLRKNRTFFFGNVERRDLDQTGLTTISDPNVAVDQRAARATGYRGPPISTGIYPNPVDTTNVLAKIDHQFSARDQFSVRYSRYDVDATNSRGAGGLSAPTASSNLDNADQSLAFSNTLMLSSRTVPRNARAVRATAICRRRRRIRSGPAVSIAGVATFGTSSSSPTGRLNRDVPDRQQPLASARRARAARRRRLPLQRRRDHLPAIGARQLHVLVARQFPGRHLQQRRLRADLRHHRARRRPIRTSASTCRTSGRSPRR